MHSERSDLERHKLCVAEQIVPELESKSTGHLKKFRHTGVRPRRRTFKFSNALDRSVHFLNPGQRWMLPARRYAKSQ